MAPNHSKSKLCRNYEEGHCTYGDSCAFSHNEVTPSGIGATAAQRPWSTIGAHRNAFAGLSRNTDSSTISSSGASDVSSVVTDTGDTSIIEDDTSDVTDVKILLPSTVELPERRPLLYQAKSWRHDLQAASPKFIAMASLPKIYTHDDLKTVIEGIEPNNRRSFVNMGRFPALFYAIQNKNESLAKLLLKIGANPSKEVELHLGLSGAAEGSPTALQRTITITPLIFALVHSNYLGYEDSISMVKLLLAYGATVDVVPPELTVKIPVSGAMLFKLSKSIDHRFILARLNASLTVVTRYWIEKARRKPLVFQRESIMIEQEELQELRKADYYEIGQEAPCRRLHELMLNRLLIPKKDRQPLVLAFAGPPGHGKTNLAKGMAEFAGTKYLHLNMAATEHLMDILGGSLGVEGAQTGSRYNNFLAEHSGKISIVILDEFDKCPQKVRDLLLTTLEDGDYYDRRDSLTKIDCKQTIFIICTNSGAEKVKDFYKANKSSIESHDPRFQDKLRRFCETQMRMALKDDFKVSSHHHYRCLDATDKYNTLILRLEFVVLSLFCLFTEYEALVAAGQCLYELRRSLGPHNQIALNPESQEAMVEILEVVSGEYDIDSGYRSLKRGTDDYILSRVREAYLNTDQPFLVKPEPTEEVQLEDIRIGTTKTDDVVDIIARKL